MKKVFITLALALAFTAVQAQKKSIIGIWHFDGIIVEFTDKQFGKYGSDQGDYLDYKIVGDKIVVENEPAKFKWQGKDKLILTFDDDDDEIVLQRIIPSKNKILKRGIYYITAENGYCYFNFKDDLNVEFGNRGRVLPIRYLVVDTKLYVINEGHYITFEIKDSETFKGNEDQNFEDNFFKLVTLEEFKEKNRYGEIIGAYFDDDLDEAIKLAQQAIAKYPNEERYYSILSDIYSTQDDYPQAIDISNRILQINPQNVSTLGNLSFYYLFVKDYKTAEQMAKKALNIDETQLWIRANLATALLFQDQYETAESIFLELKDEYCFESQYRTCAEAWLDDFGQLEKAGAIPESQKQNVKKLRKILDEDMESRINESGNLTDEQEQEVMDVVKIWFEEMIKGSSINRIMQVSDVPFAFDREKVITTTDELRQSYLGLFEEMKANKIPEYEVDILDYENQILWGYIPLNFVKVAVTVINSYSGFTVVVCVIIRDNAYKVVGFSATDENLSIEVAEVDEYWETEETEEIERNMIAVPVFNGEKLKVSEGWDFPCVVVEFMGNSTYFEIKRRDGQYMIWEKKYKTINDGVEDYLKDNFKRFYKDKKQWNKVWEEFVKNGGLQQVIEFVNKIIDDEFLDSPVNEIYG